MSQSIPNTQKALEAILWMTSERPGIDIYGVVKCLYFADLDHLARYGRTIFGERYEAEEYGPLGKVAYGVIKGRLDEMIALDTDYIPLDVQMQKPWSVRPLRSPNLDLLSQSDLKAMGRSLESHADKSFGALVRETHQHMAYMRATGGMMRSRDMLAQMIGEDDQERLDDVENDLAQVVF